MHNRNIWSGVTRCKCIAQGGIPTPSDRGGWHHRSHPHPHPLSSSSCSSSLSLTPLFRKQLCALLTLSLSLSPLFSRPPVLHVFSRIVISAAAAAAAAAATVLLSLPPLSPPPPSPPRYRAAFWSPAAPVHLHPRLPFFFLTFVSPPLPFLGPCDTA
ncbi:hypothetical protein BCV70DRAFT_34855 [Testicularia cyperi]|uniref:Uncharacterized protein n=1 Tax=Testicularia cyperi TaxID=1882483 RepID=A0A317XK01_9BASI|nr:hypothetical protein BCV70DRAFT_34855 [Testicularia cyperi]